jgi:1-deoxy-D-xylulose-5-phosphate reductoisomerase
MNKIKNITILGATGSIGMSTLDVIARHPDKYRVFALSAATSVDKMVELCVKFNPRYAVMADDECGEALAKKLISSCETMVLTGGSDDALETIAGHADVDVVMAAIVGAAGLKPTMQAARSGKTVLLANKEALVMAGKLFMNAIRENGASLLPIDSEHNAIFQSLPRNFETGLRQVGVEKIVLTASGGPFRNRPISDLAHVTPAEACAHPNWVMGKKISVDSATMMNKGLEVIEAHYLFNAPADKIDVVIHPQSVIHSMVTYRDGSVIAQLGNPDMRTPIAYGLAYPERIDAGVAPLDFAKVGKLEFQPLDMERFPCVRLAYEAMQRGGTAPTILNAANEVAVESFLQEKLRFVDIPRVIEETLTKAVINDGVSLEVILRADDNARNTARHIARHITQSIIQQ